MPSPDYRGPSGARPNGEAALGHTGGKPRDRVSLRPLWQVSVSVVPPSDACISDSVCAAAAERRDGLQACGVPSAPIGVSQGSFGA
jgi:hypothetical protein